MSECSLVAQSHDVILRYLKQSSQFKHFSEPNADSIIAFQRCKLDAYMIDRLCPDMLSHVASFLTSAVDHLNLHTVVSMWVSVEDLARCPEYCRRLVWYYIDPPLAWHFHATNVLEIPSLEPHCYYRSFAVTPFSIVDPYINPPLRKVRHIEVIHVHRTWVVPPGLRRRGRRFFSSE